MATGGERLSRAARVLPRRNRTCSSPTWPRSAATRHASSLRGATSSPSSVDAGRPIHGIGEPIWAGRSDGRARRVPAARVAAQPRVRRRPRLAAAVPVRRYGAARRGPRRGARAPTPASPRRHPAVAQRRHRVERRAARGGTRCRRPSGEPVELAFGTRRARVRYALLRPGDPRRARPRRATEDLVLGVDEVAANSLLHGGGSGVLRVWRGRRPWCARSCDRRITDPLVGRRSRRWTGRAGAGCGWPTSCATWCRSVPARPAPSSACTPGSARQTCPGPRAVTVCADSAGDRPRSLPPGEGDAAVEFLAPTTWADALAARSEHPGAVPIAGGTDVMVELNFDRHRPTALLDLTRVPELREWSRTDDGGVRLGAGVTLHPGDDASSPTGARAGDGRRARSGRRRSATAARSAATSARRRRPATPPGAARRRRGGRGRVGARHPRRSRSPTSSPASSAARWSRTS